MTATFNSLIRFLHFHVLGSLLVARFRSNGNRFSLTALSYLALSLMAWLAMHEKCAHGLLAQDFLLPSAIQGSDPLHEPVIESEDDSQMLDLGYLRHEHEVEISGTTVNDDGQPVAGAWVFVVPVYSVGVVQDNDRILAEGKTDAQGQYRFERVKLSVLEFPAGVVPKPSEALFQVFAIAEGHGYVWRHTRAYRPELRPDALDQRLDSQKTQPNDAHPEFDSSQADDEMSEEIETQLQHVFFSDDPIVIDLKFSPEVRVQGTIRDDLGNPLKNAVVQLGLVNARWDQLGTFPSGLDSSYLPRTPRAVDGRFEGLTFLPEEFRQGRTDAAGRYEIRGIPRDCQLVAFVDYLPDYDPLTVRVQTKNAAHPKGRNLGYAGAFDHVFVKPISAAVTVTGPEGQPISGVVVRQESGQKVRRAGSIDRTNNVGIATLKLRPGKSTIIAEPTIGQPFLPTSQAITFKADTRECAVELKLEAAAEVHFTAVEKDSGQPIAGVAFLSEGADDGSRQALQSQISFVDHPRTDESGQMHACLTPGSRRFVVDLRRSPADFEPIAPTTEAIDLKTGKVTQLRFEFGRRAVTAEPESTPEPIDDDLKPVIEQLERQAVQFDRSKRARFRIQHSNFLARKILLTEMMPLLESFPTKSLEECLKDLNCEFPEFEVTGTEIITDGQRLRSEDHYPGPESGGIHVFNGEETIMSMGRSQIMIYGRGQSSIGFHGPAEFWNVPLPRDLLLKSIQLPAGESLRRTVRHAKGVWEVEVTVGTATLLRVIDESTGFEHRSSTTYGDDRSGRSTWQFFPTVLPTGIAVPNLWVEIAHQNGVLTSLEVTRIHQVELIDKLPAETFILAASGGTNICDYRGIPQDEMFERHPPSSVVTSAIPDVVAYRNKFAPPPEPVLKVGDQAPALNVLVWLDREGKTIQPTLDGRIVVIDFWGIGCGPCVAGLPQVNAAAKHFLNSKIMVVGLHDGGGTVETVAGFAKRKGLIFPIAIDKERSETSFGQTFAAFGIDAMPTSVVIDTNGRVAFIGEFERAIEHADRLSQSE